MHELIRGRSGSVTVFSALCMIVLMGAVAMAVDTGQIRLQKSKLQDAVDAAALAGVLEGNACGGVPSCTAMKQAVSAAMVENGVTPTSTVMNCAAAPTTGTVLIVNNPPCALGLADPNYLLPGYVEVIARQTQSTFFARVLGINTMSVTARAEGGPGVPAPCIYALKTFGNATLVVDPSAKLISSCAAQEIATSSAAVDCELGAVLIAPSFNFAGGMTPYACIAVPTPQINATITAGDPLLSLPTPSVPACGTTTTSPFHGSPTAVTVFGTATFYSDKAYCGGISIALGATVTFQPGTYVLTSNASGGGLTLNVGANVTGAGVTFYNYGPSGKISFIQALLAPLSGINLVAPKTGTYAGILFFQDVNDTDQATIFGSANFLTVLEGIYYFPGAKVSIAYSGLVHYNGLVAYTVELMPLTLGSVSVTTLFTSDYSQLPAGSPLANSGNSGGTRTP